MNRGIVSIYTIPCKKYHFCNYKNIIPNHLLLGNYKFRVQYRDIPITMAKISFKNCSLLLRIRSKGNSQSLLMDWQILQPFKSQLGNFLQIL